MPEAARSEYDITFLCVNRRAGITYFEHDVTREYDPPLIEVKVPMSFASGPGVLANCKGSVLRVLSDCELAFWRVCVQILDSRMHKVWWFTRESGCVSVD